MFDRFKIFVAIPAFNEIDLISTIEHCLSQAEHPERIHFGVVTHYNEMEVPDLSRFNNLKTINVEYPALLGVGPMRALAVSLYDREEFYLQIDAHMKFVSNWDSYAIKTYFDIKNSGFEKPLLTTYVPWWSYNEDGSINGYSEDSGAQSGVMVYSDELHRVIPQQLTEYFDYEGQNTEFAEHYGLSAHFIFTSAEFIYDVAPDLDYMFYGEEPTTAVRAWTRGYRMFSTKNPIVWHKNKNLQEGHLHEKDRMLYDGSDAELRDHHSKKQKIGEKKAQLVLTGAILGYWGAPSYDLLYEYQEKAGFDFKEFYSKNMEYRINKVDEDDILGYNMLLKRGIDDI